MNEKSLLLILVGCVCYVVDTSQSESSSTAIKEDQCRDEKKNCSDLSNLCLVCEEYTHEKLNCNYGDLIDVTCQVPGDLPCSDKPGNRTIVKKARCLFCYQTEKWEHTCDEKPSSPSCTAIQTSSNYYKTNCTVNSDVMCLGNRKFYKRIRCNWTRGHKWSTALLLSITLGGFGADRFYLGHWQEGIGKLFSFGGLGVWTLVDVLLIAIRYLGPADGSFYV